MVWATLDPTPLARPPVPSGCAARLTPKHRTEVLLDMSAHRVADRVRTLEYGRVAVAGDAMCMRAWEVRSPGPIGDGPLELVRRDPPSPDAGEIRVKVSACGVCRTDLHIAEGDLPVHHRGVVPGHEVVGEVDALGSDVKRFKVGDRAGIAWVRSTCGRCRFCRRGDENLCTDPRFTGWDDDGGYADYAVIDEDYAYMLPQGFDDADAPLLCAGIIGYRALKKSKLPPGGRLGIFGFGGSAHITMQVALHQGAEVHVVTRSAKARRLALELGAASAVSPREPLTTRLDSAIVFAPSGESALRALEELERGGRLAVAGIHLSSAVSLDYFRHLFFERELVSVTANTRADGEEFLAIADRIGVRISSQAYPLEDADKALLALSRGEVRGAAVLYTR
jgi:propanol-preferring alcohol dehydrogenase